MTRRSLLQTLGIAAAGHAVPHASAQRGRRRRPYDILIKNGEVRDPSRDLKARADVAIHDGKIAEVAFDIPAERGRDVVDAKGLYVTPGLVDLHTHCVFGVRSGIEADPIAARSGTSTWIDAGTFAYNQIEGFRRYIVKRNKCRVFGFVYLYPASRNPDIDPVKYVNDVMERTGRAAAANRDIILGVKFQVGSNMNGRHSLEFLKIARRLCDEYDLRLLSHISLAPPETNEVMELMKPGDVITHCFNEHTLGIVDRDTGKLKPSVKEARLRGVLFDVGHGSGSFNFKSAHQALDQDFLPDSISTDIYSANVNGPVFDLPTTMSKLLYLGMSFDEVLKCSTVNPARVVTPLPKLGTLRVGAPGDVALLSVDDGEFELVDAQRNKVTAKQRIVSHLTICKGKRLVVAV